MNIELRRELLYKHSCIRIKVFTSIAPAFNEREHGQIDIDRCVRTDFPTAEARDTIRYEKT